MSQTTYRIWLPVQGLPPVLYCESLHDEKACLRIELSSDTPHFPLLEISFDSFVAYQNINESYRIRTWATSRPLGATLLQVEGSPWISWLRAEAGGVLEHVNLVHYAIYTPEDCIDIVSEFPPHVAWK